MPAVNVHQQKALLPHPLINRPGVFCGDLLCCNVFLKSFHLPGNGALLNIGVVIVVTQPRSRGKQERKIQQNAHQRRRHLQVEHFCNEALSVHTCSSLTNRYPLPHTVHTRLGF